MTRKERQKANGIGSVPKAQGPKIQRESRYIPLSRKQQNKEITITERLKKKENEATRYFI